MIQRKYLLFYNLIILFFIFSCGGSEEEAITGSVAKDFSGFYIENSGDLNFLVQAANVEGIKYFHFYVKYDTLRLVYTSSSTLATNTTFILEAQEDENGVAFSYGFNSPISGDLDIMTISFSGSNYEETELRISDIYALSSSDKVIDGVQGGGICYIDDGLIIQGEVNTTESMTAWVPTGNYVWDNAYCGYIN